MNKTTHIGYIQNKPVLMTTPDGSQVFTRIFLNCRDNYGNYDKILYVAWGKKAKNLVENPKVSLEISDMLGVNGTQKTKNVEKEGGSKFDLYMYNRLDNITFLGRSYDGERVEIPLKDFDDGLLFDVSEWEDSSIK